MLHESRHDLVNNSAGQIGHFRVRIDTQVQQSHKQSDKRRHIRDITRLNGLTMLDDAPHNAGKKPLFLCEALLDICIHISRRSSRVLRRCFFTVHSRIAHIV